MRFFVLCVAVELTLNSDEVEPRSWLVETLGVFWAIEEALWEGRWRNCMAVEVLVEVLIGVCCGCEA
jgi:hypothetical protein